MNNENTIIKVNLDITGFEKSIRELITVTEIGFASISSSIVNALNMQNAVNEIKGVIKSR